MSRSPQTQSKTCTQAAPEGSQWCCGLEIRMPFLKFALATLLLTPALSPTAAPAQDFVGRHYRGSGDVEYLDLLEKARRMFEPDPQYQNLSMLYEPKWNGLVEGPTWDAWWIQNSYGTTYSILPLLREPFITFLQNSHDLWFDQMGDGKRVGAKPPFDWIAPDGALCDAARPGWIVYKQGDGRVGIHDWGMEFTAAGVLMQAELLLINREAQALRHYLPLLERSARFVESRRDPANNLFLAGPAGNLLAPSYAGWKKPDGSYGQAYLAGLSITWIAALDRLIELEKLSGRHAEAEEFSKLKHQARSGLARLTTEEGYFIRSLDPDGVKHGVYGAARHGYFEASPNHDAIAFRVADDSLAQRIWSKMVSIPGLRPHHFVLPNYPSYDDMYEKPEGLWAYGTWVNGGHWSTCEARMVLAYYRLGQFEEARKSMRCLLTFADRFRMDNPLTKCGSDVYQPHQPINLCYDSFGPAAAFMRGLFEYLYTADTLTLIPHIPPRVTELHQADPARFGRKRLFLSTFGSGPITSVRVNGRKWKDFTADSVVFPFAKTPDNAQVQILLGGAPVPNTKKTTPPSPRVEDGSSPDPRATRLRAFLSQSRDGETSDAYPLAHARLTLRCFDAAESRKRLLQTGAIPALPETAAAAAQKCYTETAAKLYEGFEAALKSSDIMNSQAGKRHAALWQRCR